MKFYKFDTCKLCGKQKILGETSFLDPYCEDCLRLVIGECEQAILKII